MATDVLSKCFERMYMQYEVKWTMYLVSIPTPFLPLLLEIGFKDAKLGQREWWKRETPVEDVAFKYIQLRTV